MQLRHRLFRIAVITLALSAAALSQKIATDPAQPTIPPVPGLLADTLTAKRLTPGEKFHIRVIEQSSWGVLVGSAIGGAFFQASNTPRQWGQGWGAFAERTASLYGTAISYQAFTLGLETVLREDPRYFPSSQKNIKLRFWSVLKQSLVVKRDDGHATFAYARVGGAFASGFLTNSWQPHGYNGVGDGLSLGAINLLGQAGFNLVQEFLPFTRNSHFRRQRP